MEDEPKRYVGQWEKTVTKVWKWHDFLGLVGLAESDIEDAYDLVLRTGLFDKESDELCVEIVVHYSNPSTGNH